MTVNFRMMGKNAEVWNAMNGESTPANVKDSDNNSTAIQLNFEPYQSHVVIFSNRKNSDAKPNETFVGSQDLSKDWKVTIGTNSKQMNILQSWTDDETTKFYSGSATYQKSVNLLADDLKNNHLLDFGESKPLEFTVQRNGMRTYIEPPIREAAVIYINEKRAGSLWCPPYKLNISKYLQAGENKIRVVVGNTALNYMAGRKLPDYKLLNLRYGERFQAQEMEKVVPQPSGLLGKISLISTK